MRTVYLDYNATTPLDNSVREAMLPFLGEVWGNPSSIHHLGRRARSALDEFRERSAQVLSCLPSELVFTSGGTESINLALLGTARLLKPKGRHLISSAVEHHAVLHCLQYLAKRESFDLTVLPVDADGLVTVNSLENALRPDTVLVSIQAANNEIGTIQPVAELGSLCRNRGVVFHTDAVQWFGKEPFTHIEQFNADLVSLCSHKFHGPKGAGALFVRSPLHPDPLLFGGGHENERRAGTENLCAIAGFTEALEKFVKTPVFRSEHLTPLISRLRDCIKGLGGVHLVGSKSRCLTNTVSWVVEGSDSISLLAALDLEGICASSGSACSSGSLEPSHVVAALKGLDGFARSLIRFSMGRETTNADIDLVENALPPIVRRVQHRQ